MKINGSLVFDASSASEVQNLRLEKVAELPVYTAADAGRVIFLTSTSKVYYGDAGVSGYVTVATGGSAFSQNEGDAIETSLGTGINADGTFNAVAFDAPIATATSFTDAINQLASYATANNTLAELDDVSISGVTNAQYLKYNSTTSLWVADTLNLNDVTDVTTTVTELNELHSAGAVQADFIKLHAITAAAADLNLLADAAAGTGAYAAGALSATQLSYLGGATPVTSSIQYQLDNKQPVDADLTALASLSATGIVVRSAADTYALRSLVAPAAGITISNEDGVSGNPTFALANDLAALEGLTTTGYIVRTGDGTAATRSMVGTAGNIVITNGDGVSSDTSFDLAEVTQTASGNFVKITLDGFGRVTGNTAVVTADITTLVDNEYVRQDGTKYMTADLNVGGFKIVSLATPTADTDAATKAYVDAMQNGLSWKQAVVAASTANLTLSGTQTVDGVVLVTGNRVLVKDQTTASENGIYVVAAGAWVRAEDMNAPAEFDGGAVFVQQGTANEGTGWTETMTVTAVGTSPVAFSQFSGGMPYVWGIGLAASGNTINVNLGAGIFEQSTDGVGIDLFDTTTGALVLTANGSTRDTSDASKLHLLLDVAGALAQSSSGLRIDSASVTNAMLVNPSITLNSDTGTYDLQLGGTLEIKGTSTAGISTSNVNGVVTLTISDASSSQKGVATFNAGDFLVTAGDVTIKSGGVDNDQLAYSTINFIGSDTSADTVSLGENLSFIDGGTHAGLALVKTSVAANGVTIAMREATTGAAGVASFNSTMFSVTAGAVSISSTLGTVGLSNVDATVDAAASEDILSYNGTKWINQTPATVAGTMNLGELKDVGSASPSVAGKVLVADGTNWQAASIYYMHTQSSAATTWSVSHGLGVKYCTVTIIDANDEVVIPQSITFNSTTGLTVVFNTAIAGKVVVMGVA
jgi:hypothetical protein